MTALALSINIKGVSISITGIIIDMQLVKFRRTIIKSIFSKTFVKILARSQLQ